MTHALIAVLLILMALFLILLVLVQRGRGGGLAGALGGAGGQSAFGAKAGDTFTKVTMWTAFLWIVLCVIGVKVLKSTDDALASPAGMSASGALDSSDPRQKSRTDAADAKKAPADATDKSSSPTADSTSAEPGQSKSGTDQE